MNELVELGYVAEETKGARHSVPGDPATGTSTK